MDMNRSFCRISREPLSVHRRLVWMKGFVYSVKLRATASTNANGPSLGLVYRATDKTWAALMLEGRITGGASQGSGSNGLFLEGNPGGYPGLAKPEFSTKNLALNEWYVLSLALGEDGKMSVWLELIGAKEYAGQAGFFNQHGEGHVGFRSWGGSHTYATAARSRRPRQNN